MWRELLSLTVGDPNPCERPAYVCIPRFPLHCPALDTSIVLALKFVSHKTLIMARKHCCCDSCRHNTWQITFERLEMLGTLPEARTLGTCLGNSD